MKILDSFVEERCSLFVNGQCAYDTPCFVLNDKRCIYFEAIVLGMPKYRFRKSGYDYEKIFEQYKHRVKKDFPEIRAKDYSEIKVKK